MGDQAEAIYKQITVADGDEEQLYDRTVAAFETYFKPQSTEIHYRIMFSKRNQRTGETDENLILDLQDLSLKCGWDEEHRKSQMSTQLLAGMVDKTLSQELQLDPNLTVDVITSRMRAKEVLLEIKDSNLMVLRQIYNQKPWQP